MPTETPGNRPGGARVQRNRRRRRPDYRGPLLLRYAEMKFFKSW